MTESIPTHLPKLADQLGTPITIGGKSIPNRLWLAPMAGLTHTAFRQVLAHYGSCGLAFTEMCSARAVPTENPRISPVFSWHEWELPSLVCQIVGAEPEEMVIAAERVEREGFFGVDINMGCSARGMIKREAGAALLKTPDKAVAIVEAVRKAVSIPVFVKFRTGWSRESDRQWLWLKTLKPLEPTVLYSTRESPRTNEPVRPTLTTSAISRKRSPSLFLAMEI